MNYALPLISVHDCREFAIALRLSNRLVIPKHKTATPFCVFKTITGFGF